MLWCLYIDSISSFTQQLHLLYSTMRKGMSGDSKRLAMEQRKITREDIFARNRRYLEMTKCINYQHFDLLTMPYQVDPAYRTIIETLARMSYGRNIILELVDLLEHNEIMRVYEGMVGLKSFGDGIMNVDIEEEFLGSGVVPKLFRLAQLNEHPYLKFASLKLLKQIAQSINLDRFKAFFNLETTPFSFFFSSLFLQDKISKMVMDLFRIINQRSIYIQAADRNIHILQAIELLIQRAFPDTKDRIAQKLSILNQILNKVHLNFQLASISFANKYFLIKRQLIRFYQRTQMSDQLFQEMIHLCNRIGITTISQAISSNQKNLRNATIFIFEMINAGFKVRHQGESSTFSQFMTILIGSKPAKQFLSHDKLLETAERIVLQNFKQEQLSYKVVECVHIITDIFSTCEYRLFYAFLSKFDLLQALSTIYDTWEDEKIICGLNKMVRKLICNSQKKGVMEILDHYRFIQRYIESCCRLEGKFMKEGLKAMMRIVMQLKEGDIKQYKVIRKEVVDEENYATILKTKSIRGARQTFNFFKKLKDEEQKDSDKSDQRHLVQVARHQ